VPDTLIASIRRPFRAIAETVVPEATALDPPGWVELERLVEGTLAKRQVSVQRQLRLFVRVLDALAVLRYGRRLSALDARRRARLLEVVQDSPILLIRRGFWGLRTLILMGYYGRPAAAAEVGYRADACGWEAREARRP
jgi:hypothetical protein